LKYITNTRNELKYHAHANAFLANITFSRCCTTWDLTDQKMKFLKRLQKKKEWEKNYIW